MILATFNRATLLPRALGSLQNQSFHVWRAVIVNDGSTDMTMQVVRHITANDDRFETITMPRNCGVDLARNAGLRLVTTPLVTFLDSDDEYKIDHLANRVTFMQNNPQVDLIYGGIEVIGPAYVPDRFNPKQLVAIANCVTAGTTVVKTSVMSQLGGFRQLPYASDADFVDRARVHGARIQIMTEPTYIYHREMSDSITHNLARQG